MPTITFKTKDEIPAGLQEHATQAEDGTFKVGVVHEGFRDKNIALLQERDALNKTVSDLKAVIGTEDADKFAAELTTLRETAQKVADGKLSKKEDIEAEVARRMAERTAALEGQIKSLSDKVKASEDTSRKYEANWKLSVLDNALTQAVMAADSGANPQALPDILARGRSTFRVKDDGTLVAMQGETILYGEDGQSSMKPGEWIAGLIKQAPYLGKASTGGGATGDSKGSTGGLSEQDFAKLDPAERLARHRAASGSK